LAFAVAGDGPPIVKAANWVTHLDYDWRSPVWGHWLRALTRRNLLLRYDARGCGLCDHEDVDFSFARYIEDLEAVVDAAAPERFTLFGIAGGGATAVAYAARHPERVQRMVLVAPFVRGRFARSRTSAQLEEEKTLLRLIEIGWGKDDPSFRQLFVSQFLQDATPEQFASFNALMRHSATPSNAARLMRGWFAADVSALAPRVKCPTLILHPRDALRVPFEEGRALAGLIRDARFVPLDSRNLIVLEQEPAWRSVVDEIDRFLAPAAAGDRGAGVAGLSSLTARERQVVELIARGLGNAEIGARLSIGDKTVRNRISMILGKLDLHSRAQLIVLARESGFGQSAAS
jgi:pimeloyl-ACP methyl ester carboxylesterase/DNA-binding CsgD family transcriptional regulator